MYVTCLLVSSPLSTALIYSITSLRRIRGPTQAIILEGVPLKFYHQSRKWQLSGFLSLTSDLAEDWPWMSHSWHESYTSCAMRAARAVFKSYWHHSIPEWRGNKCNICNSPDSYVICFHLSFASYSCTCILKTLFSPWPSIWIQPIYSPPWSISAKHSLGAKCLNSEQVQIQVKVDCDYTFT